MAAIPPICKACDSKTHFLTEKILLSSHKVTFFQCKTCKMVRTEPPFWLNAAYAEAIADMDTGIMERNLKQRALVTWFITLVIGKNKKYVDFGGGYGIFTRLMRDRGFDFYWYDAYASNLFAKKFIAKAPESEAEALEKPFSLVTTFEVAEHLEDFRSEVSTMLRYADHILFTTLLLPSTDHQKLTTTHKKWWYWSEETGQHISFYTEKSLLAIARYHKLHFFTNGRNLHFFSRSKKGAWFFRLLRAIEFVRKCIPNHNLATHIDRLKYKNAD